MVQKSKQQVKSNKKSSKSSENKTEVPVEEVQPVVEQLAEEVSEKVASEVATEVVASTVVVDDDNELNSRFVSVSETLKNMISNTRTLLKDLNDLHRDVSRRMKTLQKGKKGHKNRDPNKVRKPSGFTKPTKISDELADFCGVAHGAEMARNEVTKFINSYVKENNLKDAKDGRQILAHNDKKLYKLLGNPTGVVTFFQLQKLVNHHYIKSS